MKLTPEGIREAFKIIEAPDIYSAHIVNGAQEILDTAALRLADLMEKMPDDHTGDQSRDMYCVSFANGFNACRQRILDLINAN